MSLNQHKLAEICELNTAYINIQSLKFHSKALLLE